MLNRKTRTFLHARLATFISAFIGCIVWTMPSLAAETALDRYVAQPDANYSFSERSSQRGVGYTAHFLSMTSQQWRSPQEVDRTLWTHEVVVVIPQVALDKTKTAVLLIDGGNNDNAPMYEIDSTVGAIAVARGVIIALVRQVPNQPLYFADDHGRARKEDEIIGYSLDKALTTGDAQWAVHLPMTKAAVRAMDTVQTFAKQRGKTINDFIVMGGSKRGWATWLTAAVDQRVRAFVPASIDMLNLGQQFVHHWEAYGFFAPALKDYVEFDLPCRVQTPQGQALLQVVDPYAYRDRYTMPKLILNSTGDQFFVTDSTRFYFADLPGLKWLRYAPNTDHKQSENVILAGLSWVDDMLDNKLSPQLTWALEGEDTLRVTTSSNPKEVKLWQATNARARDFRLETIGANWHSQVLKRAADGSYVGTVQRPARGWSAFMVEATFAVAGPSVLNPDQVYTTEVQMLPDTLPFAGTACPGTVRATLESPQQSAFESGIGLIRGWVCNAKKVEVQINNQPRQSVGYGTLRSDTAEVCGNPNSGFGYTVNWNSLGDGAQRLRAFADGKQFADVSFNVTTLGTEFLHGVNAAYTLPNFPHQGQNVQVRWAEAHQNFVIAAAQLKPQAAPTQAAAAHLESPQQGSFESGIGLIRGWVCNAKKVEVQINDEPRQSVAYGTTRNDTAAVCGNANSGFGYTVNWNSLGDGTQRLRAFADEVQFADVQFTVTTLGVDYLRGASGEYVLPNFPSAGKSSTLRWVEPQQNFVIIKR